MGSAPPRWLRELLQPFLPLAATEQEARNKVQPAMVPQVKPRRRQVTRAQKKAVEKLDEVDPSASSKGKSVQLPALVPPGRSKSVLDEAPDARAGIAAPSPARFRSQSVEPIPATMDPRHTTMVWSPPHPTVLLDKRTDLRTMFANGALTLVPPFMRSVSGKFCAPVLWQILENSTFTSDVLPPT